jgi:hypothetical protein
VSWACIQPLKIGPRKSEAGACASLVLFYCFLPSPAILLQQ